MEEDYLNEEYREKGSKSNPSFLVTLFLILPIGTLLGIGEFYLLLLKVKWRPKYTNIIFAIQSLIVLVLYFLMNPFGDLSQKFFYLTSNPLSISLWLSLLWKPYMFISLFGANIIAIFNYNKATWYMSKFPKILYDPDTMVYGYTYNESIFEKKKREALIAKLKSGKGYEKKASPIGITDEPVLYAVSDTGKATYDYEPSIVRRFYKGEGTTGTLLTGTTGAGKTMVMLQLILNDLKNKKPIILVDFKRGPDYAYYLSKYAKELDVPFYHFINGKPGEYQNPYCSHQATYDPLSSDSVEAKTDLILSLRAWDDISDVYKKRQEDISKNIFLLLDNIEKDRMKDLIRLDKGGFISFLDCLNYTNLLELLNIYNEQWAEEEMNGIKHTDSEITNKNSLDSFYQNLTDNHTSKLYIEQMIGLSQVIGSFIKGSYGSWFAKSNLSPYHINLTELGLSEKPFVVLFQFNSLNEPDFSRKIGNMIMMNIGQLSSDKNQARKTEELGLYIDEFQILDPSIISGILAKVRSSGIYTTISSQTLHQITLSAAKNGEQETEGMLDNINNFIVLNGSGEKTAMKFSEQIGKIKKPEYSVISSNETVNGLSYYLSPLRIPKTKNKVNSKLVSEYAVPPEKIQKLMSPVPENNFKSTAYYITKSCMEPKYAGKGLKIARRVHIILDNELIEGTPDEFIEMYNGLSTDDNNDTIPIMNVVPENEDNSSIFMDLEKIDNNEDNLKQELKLPGRARIRKPLNKKSTPPPKPNIINDDYDEDIFIFNPPKQDLPPLKPNTSNKKNVVTKTTSLPKNVNPINQIKKQKKEKIKNEVDKLFS